MTTEEMGVGLGPEDRARLLRYFQAMVLAKTEEQNMLRPEVACGCKNHGDMCDRAQGEIDVGPTGFRLDAIHDELMRIRAVMELLRAGWDGLCVTCEDVSVVPRLNAGFATRRCCACKTVAELKEKQKRAPYSPAFLFIV